MTTMVCPRVAPTPPRGGRPRRAPVWLRVALAIFVAVLLPCAPGTTPALAQARPAQSTPEARLRQQQDELNRIRREREELQARMRQLQGSVRDLSSEVRNLERQAEATARLVRSLDDQLIALTAEVDSATNRLVSAEHDLTAKRLTLRKRVRDIYKRGALFDVEALLSAHSFGELLARYKYLHQLARHDRLLVQQVGELRDRIDNQRQLLVRLHDEVAANRTDKAEEETRLRSLEQTRQRTLSQTQRTAAQTQERLAQIARDETRVRNLIASLEEARRKAAAGTAESAAASRSTIRTSDIDRLDWPVDGDIIYRFGRVVNPNNTTTRWNGIGIAAPTGTRVRAIADGEVVLAETIGTYGLTVIVQHGGGDYSVYGSLAEASVKVGARVTKGQAVGTVGVADPDLPSHLHFEIRRDRGAAVDPLEWLKGNR